MGVRVRVRARVRVRVSENTDICACIPPSTMAASNRFHGSDQKRRLPMP